MSLKLFVAGSHTDVGKTYVACRLLEAARARGLTVAAFKPVITGFDPSQAAESDTGRLLAAMGRAVTPQAVEAVSPLRFDAPLAPPMAAAAEGRTLPFAELAALTRDWLTAQTADLVLVEGAGGLMSPIADGATALDLMLALAIPAVMVGGTYLGAISHTLTALETARYRGLSTLALFVSEAGEADAPDFAATVGQLRAFAGDTPVIPVRRNGGGVDWSKALELLGF